MGVIVLVMAAVLLVLKEPVATEGSVEYLHKKAGRKGEDIVDDAYAGYWAPLLNRDFRTIAVARIFYFVHFAGEGMLLYFFRDGLNLKETESRYTLASMGLVTCGVIIVAAFPVA